MSKTTTLEYTYWRGTSGLLVGYLNLFPDHPTQGKDLAELEIMLADIYKIRLEEEAEEAMRIITSHKTGILELDVALA